MARFYQSYDVLLTPTSTTPPLPLTDFVYDKTGAAGFLEQFWRVAAFMPIANVSGHPAMTVPLWSNETGLPVGSQFGARFGDEDTLLRLAVQLEQAAPWSQRKPPIAAAV